MYLQRYLAKQVPSGVRKSGDLIYESGKVTVVSGNQWHVAAKVQGSRIYSVKLTRNGDSITADCDCANFDINGICKHVWAAIDEADRKYYLLGRIGGGIPKLADVFDEDFEDFDDDGDDLYPAIPKPPPKPKPVKPPPPPPWRNFLAQVATSHSRTHEDPWPANREIYYVLNAGNSTYNQTIYVDLLYQDRNRNGELRKAKSQRVTRGMLKSIPSADDREILSAMSGGSEYSYYGNDVLGQGYSLKGALAETLIPKICKTGRFHLPQEAPSYGSAGTALAWDDGPPWQFRLQVARKKTGTPAPPWLITGYLARGDDRMDLNEPALQIENLVLARGLVSRVDSSGASGWIGVLKKQSQIEVPAEHGQELVSEILKQPDAPEIDWPEDLRFEKVQIQARPQFKIGRGDRYGRPGDKVVGELSFIYGDYVAPGHEPARGIYEPSARRFLLRDQAAELAAIQLLSELGAKKLDVYYSGPAGMKWELSSKKLPRVVRDLALAGWHIESDGKAFRSSTGFRMEITSGIDWFELHGAVDFGDGAITLPELLKAMQKGENLVALADGSYGILPEELLKKYGLLMRTGRTEKDHVRFSRTQAGLLDVFLAERPEIKVDEIFARARQELRRFEGILPAPQPEGFAGVLRGYQQDGLGWMHFLRQFGFGGCLADDMGVGKTPQVLALLETRRQLRAAKKAAGEPAPPASLVVVPRSLVYNWKQEAARFTPALRVLEHLGLGRSQNVERFSDYDVILTTYGTLRRDVVGFEGTRFDYIVLDEAQAIKNASSESAKAARLLAGDYRIAMSGTPVENHLGELWSLFEFLNPGMLGGASVFQLAGGALRNPDEETRKLLGRAVRPFILRRTKDQVATELPPKVEQTLYCELDTQQRKLYNDLRDHYRQSLLGRIAADGLAKSKMHVLEALLRLRQAACHPGLIDKQRAGESSAKLDLLIPQIAQVVDEGHKALVFSQFTSLLSILRPQLAKESIAYEYLDGKTRDREACVTRFQNDPDCKLFLISLKAGGLGLNLTAAEYVYLLDPWWNPAVEAQAIDRAHRIGQAKQVFAYRLIARDTVEEKVLQLQNTKRDLADAIINADNRLIGNLGREDLELLLS